MARKAIYKHATQVNVNTHPDDGTSPVGSAEWNELPDPQGMIGNTPTTSTITIASGVATPTDSITVATSESSTTDVLDKLAVTNTNEYDLIYLFANTGHTITLTHTASPSASGHIFTVSGANETLSVTKPTILIRKGTYWYGYGGGAAPTPTDITVADESSDATCFPLFVTAATGDLAPKSGSNFAFNSNTGILTATGFAGDITGDVTGDVTGALTGNASGTALTVTQAAQSAITSTGTLTGLTMGGAVAMGGNDITNGGVIFLTEQAEAEADIAGKGQIWVDTQTPNKLYFTDDAGTDTDLTAGGGATIVHTFVNTTTTGYLGTASSFGTVGAGDRDIYIKKIDTYNEGVFTKIWKNGSAVEVQLA